MSIFDSLSGGAPQIQNGSRNGVKRQHPMLMLMQLKRNPVNILRQSRFNIPSNVRDPGDGSGYMKYLLDTGQINDEIMGLIENEVSRRR